MSPNAAKSCAYFQGIVDVCEREDGELVFLHVEDGELIVSETITIKGVVYRPPSHEKLPPFLVPRLSEVQRHYERDDANLHHDLLAYMKRFSALDDLQWAVLVIFVCMTYLHDHQDIDYCPYLIFYAVPERGKSRTGKSIINVAFRGLYMIELREAFLFRYCEYYHGTLFLDITDVSKKAEQSGCNDLLLNRAEKGAHCPRVLNPEQGPIDDITFFANYGPTIIASNRQIEHTLNTRCLPIDMPNIPGYYDNPRPEFGLELKERLTAMRAKYLYSPLPLVTPVDGISGRLWDITKPMLQVNALVNPDGNDQLIKAILEISEKRTDTKQDTTEGRLVQAIKELTEEKGFDDYQKWNLKTFEISNKYYENRPDDTRFAVSWFAKKLISMSIRHRKVHGISEMLFTSDEYERLLEQYGFKGSGTNQEIAPSTIPLPLKDVLEQQVSLQVEGGSGKQEMPEKPFSNPDEYSIYIRTMNSLIQEGGRSSEERDRICREAVKQWRKENDVPF